MLRLAPREPFEFPGEPLLCELSSSLNCSTRVRSSVAISVSSCAAFRVSCAPRVVLSAAVATPWMFCEISPEPLAASCTLRDISFVVALCSSTAVAMVLEISLIWWMMPVLLPIESTARLVSS